MPVCRGRRGFCVGVVLVWAADVIPAQECPMSMSYDSHWICAVPGRGRHVDVCNGLCGKMYVSIRSACGL